MKKFKFCVLGLLFMLLILAPIPCGLVWGYKAIPIAVILYAVAWRIVRILYKYN